MAIPAGWGLFSAQFNNRGTQQEEDQREVCNSRALDLLLELTRTGVHPSCRQLWDGWTKLTGWLPNSPAPRSCCPETRSSHFWAPLHKSKLCTVVARRLRASSDK